MTGYPQTIVYVGYIVTGFVVYSLVELRREGIGAALKTGGMLLLAALLGVVTSLPLYADIYALSLESERTNAAYSFFSGAAVKVRGFIQIMKIVSQLTHPEVFGNVSTGSYPFAHMNSALPAMVSLFAYFGMIRAWRQSRYWVVVIGALIIMNFVPSVFWFAYEYMGFGISRHVPYELLKNPVHRVCRVRNRTAGPCARPECAQRTIRHCDFDSVGTGLHNSNHRCGTDLSHLLECCCARDWYGCCVFAATPCVLRNVDRCCVSHEYVVH
jgi:hypothetical protein